MDRNFLSIFYLSSIRPCLPLHSSFDGKSGSADFNHQISWPMATSTTMHFWSPEIDPAHPMDCTQAERYVLRRLSNGSFIAIDGKDQSLSMSSPLTRPMVSIPTRPPFGQLGS
jgi:hypothetical protein